MGSHGCSYIVEEKRILRRIHDYQTRQAKYRQYWLDLDVCISALRDELAYHRQKMVKI